MSLDIQIVSDLHLEFWGGKTKFNFVKPSAPILALLGDSCCCGSDDDFDIFKRFISEIIDSYKHIIIVSGNHEYYFNPPSKSIKPDVSNTIDGVDNKLKEFCKSSPKLHYLNNGVLKMIVGKKSYMIIGSTLWSWIPEDQRVRIQTSMNDYRYIYVVDKDTKKIRNINATDISNMFVRNVRYIKSQLAKVENSRVILFVHHKPYVSSDYNPKSYDPAYMSDLSKVIKKPITFVAYGHTHIADSSTISGITYYSNPKGYPKQKTNYNHSSVVKIN